MTAIAQDWSWVEVALELTPPNANFCDTARGGTLSSMLDPFLPILIQRQLGVHAVWQQAAGISLARLGRSPISSRLEVPAEVIEEIRPTTGQGGNGSKGSINSRRSLRVLDWV